MLQTLKDAFTPVLWGGVLALILNLPLRTVETQCARFRPRIRRAVGLVLVLLGAVAFLFLGLWLLLPQLATAVTSIGVAIPTLYGQVQDFLGGWCERFVWGTSLLEQIDLRSIKLEDATEQAMSELMSVSVAVASYTAQQLARFAVALVLAIYLLASKENLAHKGTLVARAVLGDQKAMSLIVCSRRAGEVFASFMVGQCVEACILASLFVLVLFFTDMPYVLPIATLIGVTAFVPVFGSIVGGVFGFLLVFSEQPNRALWFLVVFLLVQQLENNIIYPRVVGGRVGLPPFWVMLAVVVGGGLFGLAGLIVAVPAMSVCYELGGAWVHARIHAQKKEESLRWEI